MLTLHELGLAFLVPALIALPMRGFTEHTHPGHAFYLFPALACGGVLAMHRQSLDQFPLSAFIAVLIAFCIAVAFADVFRRNDRAKPQPIAWSPKDWKISVMFGFGFVIVVGLFMAKAAND